MERELIEKARKLINANYISTTLSTVDKDYNVNIAVISVLEMIGDDMIIAARFGAEKTYANLKETGKGVLMVLLADESRQTKEGIRVYIKLQDDLTAGDFYDRIKQRFKGSNYGNLPLKNCLVFKILKILPVSLLKKEE